MGDGEFVILYAIEMKNKTNNLILIDIILWITNSIKIKIRNWHGL